jgi:hypothetical protein
VNVSTVYRWTSDGCRGIKLQSLVIGTKRFTTKQWLLEFLRGLNGQTAPTESPPPGLTSPRMSSADQTIDRALDDYGCR